MQSVSVLKLRDLDKLGDITIGNIVHTLHIIQELIAVLNNHELIISHKPLFLELDSRTYTLIVLNGTFV